MGHHHLHLSSDMEHDHSHHEQMRVGLALLATLIGGVLLVTSQVAKLDFLYAPVDGHESFQVTLLEFIAAFLLGAPIILHAIKSLFHREAHMDELVALAIVAAFVMGEYKEAGIVAFFMLLSELMESRTALGARASIESLIKLTPTKAFLLNSDGSEKEVKVKELKAGDIVRVRPGDNIPADGEIVSGLSSINEATITGESLPVDKVPGMGIFAGTNNLTGVLDIKVTQAGEDTTLGKVKHLIMDAEQTKIPIMRIIDQYVKWYTPTILMVVIIVLFFSKDYNRFISMLVISCPCALILATPTAMVAAISASARMGVLVKNVGDLEVAGKMTSMVFDKTGTLTTGMLFVTKLTPADGVQPAELLTIAASAERMSKHPVARALQQVAKEANITPPESIDFTETPGKGVEVKIENNSVIVGRDTFLQENNIDVSNVEAPEMQEEQGLSTLYVGKNGKCIGWIGLQDKTRPQAHAAVSELLDIGIKRITMLTGDRDQVANRVASELGCTDYKANCLPQDKLAIVEKIKKEGHTVVVVGDGINDAPALAAGDLGIAMGAAGSDVALNSASIALMSNDLRRLPFLVKLSRQTSKVIRQNLGFGILFIILGMAAAGGGWLKTEFAAFLHFAGSLLVIFNSARLVRFGEEIDE